MAMSDHSIAEAKDHLSQLIDRALKGEKIVITRRGEPVIEFNPVRQQPRVTEADLEWLREHRARLTPAKTDAAMLVRKMRDEGET
jgi:prevent-host-death family protein